MRLPQFAFPQAKGSSLSRQSACGKSSVYINVFHRQTVCFGLQNYTVHRKNAAKPEREDTATVYIPARAAISSAKFGSGWQVSSI
jgi:hypothetical protein